MPCLCWILPNSSFLSFLVSDERERDSCFLPGCPPSVTLISPFNYSHYQPPNASLSPLGISQKWKGNAGADGRQGAHQRGCGETRGCGNTRTLPVHQQHCQPASPAYWAADVVINGLFLSQTGPGTSSNSMTHRHGKEAKEALKGFGLMYDNMSGQVIFIYKVF